MLNILYHFLYLDTGVLPSGCNVEQMREGVTEYTYVEEPGPSRRSKRTRYENQNMYKDMTDDDENMLDDDEDMLDDDKDWIEPKLDYSSNDDSDSTDEEFVPKTILGKEYRRKDLQGMMEKKSCEKREVCQTMENKLNLDDEDFVAKELDYSDSNSDSSDEEEDLPLKNLGINKRRKRPSTDDEEEDNSRARDARRIMENELESKIAEKLNGPRLQTKWIPDAEDEELLNMHIARPLMKNCKKYTHFKALIPEDVLEKIDKGQQLDAKDKKYISKTASDVTWGFKLLMFHLQERFRRDFPEKLSSDGRLKMKQFFAYKQNTFIRPFNIVELLNETIAAPSVKCKAYSGYLTLLNEVLKDVASIRGEAKFCNAITDEERSWSQEKLFSVGVEKQKILMNEITTMKGLLTVDKPFAHWVGERLSNQRAKEDHQRYFEGRAMPDPEVIIQKWMNHPSTIEMDKKIIQYAREKKIVSASEFNEITKKLVTTTMLKNGPRIEAIENITWGDYHSGRNKGFAAYPYLNVHNNPDVDPKSKAVKARTWKGRDGEQLYIREDPWKEDDLDPQDHMKDQTLFSVMKGTCATVTWHKTCAKYPMYLWFSQIDNIYIMCYLEICKLRLESMGKEMTNKVPMFMDANGDSFIKNKKGLNLDDYAEVVGLPKAKSHGFRHIITNAIYKFGPGS